MIGLSQNIFYEIKYSLSLGHKNTPVIPKPILCNNGGLNGKFTMR